MYLIQIQEIQYAEKLADVFQIKFVITSSFLRECFHGMFQESLLYDALSASTTIC